jgi:hypothetical protein
MVNPALPVLLGLCVSQCSKGTIHEITRSITKDIRGRSVVRESSCISWRSTQ